MMLAASLLLLAAHEVPGDPAEAARIAMLDSEGKVQLLEECLPDRPGAARLAAQALRLRHDALRREATGLLPYIDQNVGMYLEPVRCNRRRDTDVQGATAAVDRLEAAVTRRRAAMHGLWLGPLHLCGGAVLGVGGGNDEQDRPRLLLRFAPAMAEAVAAETTQRFHSRAQLPLVLDGRTLVSPMISEPITAGQVSIANGEPLESVVAGGVEAIRAAAARPCTL